MNLQDAIGLPSCSGPGSPRSRPQGSVDRGLLDYEAHRRSLCAMSKITATGVSLIHHLRIGHISFALGTCHGIDRRWWHLGWGWGNTTELMWLMLI